MLTSQQRTEIVLYLACHFQEKKSKYENIEIFEKGGFFTPGMTTSTDKITGWSGNNTLGHDLAYFMIEMTQILLIINTLTKSEPLINDSIQNNTFADKMNKTKIMEAYKIYIYIYGK